jgi:hypothetical protein
MTNIRDVPVVSSGDLGARLEKNIGTVYICVKLKSAAKNVSGN